MPNKKRGVLAGVVGLAAVWLLGIGLWGLWVRPPAAIQVTASFPMVVDPDLVADDPVPTPGQLVRKEGTWTFLLCARDQVSGNTDTIMVCTYDTKNQRAGLVSIPRDTLVDRPGRKYHKLNAAYPAGGVDELSAAVSELLGIPIDHTVAIDPRIFVELVDAAGGVDFDVPVHMSYDDPAQDLHIHYEPGMQHLTGQQALEVVRCRKNSDGKGSYPNNLYDAYPDADIGRTRTQQAMVKAVVQKLLTQPHKLGEYLAIVGENVKTDLTLPNLLWLGGTALGFRQEDLVTATLPGRGDVTYRGTPWCYALDIPGSLDIINDCLNPYTTPVTANMVKMLQG